MSAGKFRFRIALSVGALIAFILTFPFMLALLVDASGCRRGGGGACGAVAVVIGMFGKPLGVLILGLVMICFMLSRARAIGLGFGWAAATLAWFLAALPLLVMVGNFWGANFGLGLVYATFPTLILFLVVWIAFLSIADVATATNDDADVGIAWMVAIGAAVHGLIVGAMTVWSGLITIPYLGASLGMGVMKMMMDLVKVSNIAALGMPMNVMLLIDVVVFAAALGFIVLKGSGGSEADHEAATAPIKAAPSRGAARPQPSPARASAPKSGQPRAAFGTRAVRPKS
ncbi:MAG TPA: hypothetical protein PK264_03125 [Hyphomicrobiaceae bacterium]|nr:hypothetical protein [Hyphomicrobiaceae bacterium]